MKPQSEHDPLIRRIIWRAGSALLLDFRILNPWLIIGIDTSRLWWRRHYGETGLQRGSLLDSVLKLGGAGAVEMWRDTLARLQALDPAIGEIEQLKHIRSELRSRMGRFVNLAPGDDATAFFASDLTREHLREVVRLFIAAQPGQHLVPFGRLGTGSINLLVFALLTFIAELKDKQSVIFAMEKTERSCSVSMRPLSRPRAVAK